MKRAIVLVMDSFGVGATEDADKFGDKGSNTIGHIAKACAEGKADTGRQGPLQLPVLSSLGLVHAAQESAGEFPAGMNTDVDIVGAYGHAKELSSGKDTPSGHWEMMGVPVLYEWGYFKDLENSFPAKLLKKIMAKADIPGYLGNCHSSGTVILEQLGEEHMQTGKPIFYTSADSVFQIACHEETFGLERLYKLCELVREILEPYNIGRVIARPFIGDDVGDFQRTGNRRDYSVPPPSPTLLDKLAEKGGEVVSVGKIADIFAHQGITKKLKANGIAGLFETTMQAFESAGDQSLIFTNFVDFDSSFGHRRDVAGYAAALEQLDAMLPRLLKEMEGDDLLIITADHGCDPTWVGTDHTREHIPVLVFGRKIKPGSLGRRDTFADIGQSLARYFELEPMEYGTSFLK
ncbi:phosphopentomutase [Endozoicomonas gorgoniicola]|uniref:Phosphopentomutase n=1 Tax=Endozoicomonas gorgoniicola TaxID=1234144 RepID=A0ABT3N0N9_9GAMM|nr:phosphopentomutase [Endozoicomonas gorgoniicola]MCW7555191.1 phosphopentomutase [Endozoicomonas gorgoniicola]